MAARHAREACHLAATSRTVPSTVNRRLWNYPTGGVNEREIDFRFVPFTFVLVWPWIKLPALTHQNCRGGGQRHCFLFLDEHGNWCGFPLPLDRFLGDASGSTDAFFLFFFLFFLFVRPPPPPVSRLLIFQFIYYHFTQHFLFSHCPGQDGGEVLLTVDRGATCGG